MQKDDPVRLRHLLDAAREAELFAQNKTRSDLDTDRKLVLALVKDIEIIGEAAANITDICQENMPLLEQNIKVMMEPGLALHMSFAITPELGNKT